VPRVKAVLPFFTFTVVVAVGARTRFFTAVPDVPEDPADVRTMRGVIVTSWLGLRQLTRTRFRKKLVDAAAVSSMNSSSVFADELVGAET
jgi:hypothetical protein